MLFVTNLVSNTMERLTWVNVPVLSEKMYSICPKSSDKFQLLASVGC